MKGIQARLILEILGRPPEHIVQGMKMLIDKMRQEKGVKIGHFKIHEPTKVKDAQDLYTSFAEVEIEADSIHSLFLVAFNYMPANIEIIYPENIELNNGDFNQAINQLVQRLHNYDAVTKNVLAERDFLAQKLKEYAPHLFKQPEQAQPVVSEVKKEKKTEKKKIKSVKTKGKRK